MKYLGILCVKYGEGWLLETVYGSGVVDAVCKSREILKQGS